MEQKELLLLQAQRELRERKKCKVKIGKRKYSIRQVGNYIASKILDIELEVGFIDNELKKEQSLKDSKRLHRKIRKSFSRMAAYYLLGDWALFPFVHHYLSWVLNFRNSEVTYNIISIGKCNPDTLFFSLNCQSTRNQLDQYTKNILESKEEFQKRLQSAEAMAKADLEGGTAIK